MATSKKPAAKKAATEAEAMVLRLNADHMFADAEGKSQLFKAGDVIAKLQAIGDIKQRDLALAMMAGKVDPAALESGDPAAAADAGSGASSPAADGGGSSS